MTTDTRDRTFHHLHDVHRRNITDEVVDAIEHTFDRYLNLQAPDSQQWTTERVGRFAFELCVERDEVVETVGRLHVDWGVLRTTGQMMCTLEPGGVYDGVGYSVDALGYDLDVAPSVDDHRCPGGCCDGKLDDFSEHPEGRRRACPVCKGKGDK